MYRFAVAIALVIASVTGVTIAAAPASAAENESVLGDVFSSGDTLDQVETGIRAAWAGRSRIVFWVQQRIPAFITDLAPGLAPDRQTAEEELSSVASFYNDHNETLEAYVNDRANASTNRTIKITLHLSGESAKRYLEVNTSDGNVTSSEVVSSTDREITDRVVLCGLAADQALEELQTFHSDFAKSNEDVTQEYLARIAGKYGPDVETSLISSSGECEGAS